MKLHVVVAHVDMWVAWCVSGHLIFKDYPHSHHTTTVYEKDPQHVLTRFKTQLTEAT